MKKTILILLLGFPLLGSLKLMAQSNWLVGGNSLSTTGSFGSNTNFSVIFKTNNTERGRLTNAGFWGIGTSSPRGKLHVNSASGAEAFRAQVNGSTKLLVHGAGGVSIGSGSTPPSNGLYVSGNTGIGDSSPIAKLQVNSASGAEVFRAKVNGSTKLFVHGAGGVSIGSGSTPPSNGLYVSGSVGIGTSSPSQKLHVIGAGLFTGGLTVSNGNIYASSAGGNAIAGFGPSSGIYGSSVNYGVHGISNGTTGYGVYAECSGSSGTGVYGIGNSNGVWGESGGGVGVLGLSYSNIAVNGFSELNNGGNFESTSNDGLVAKTSNSDAFAGLFYGDVYTTGSYLPSDINIKGNVQQLGNAMAIIKKLKPVSYEYTSDLKYASLSLPKGSHYGLIAQEIEKVLPQLVKESLHSLRVVKPEKVLSMSKDDHKAIAAFTQTQNNEKIKIKAVNYTELISIIIKGMQEQDAENKVKDKKIINLETELADLRKLVMELKNNGASPKQPSAFMKQNTPNPFYMNTIIKYYTPENTTHAQITITDIKGSFIKSFVAKKGEGEINIRSGELSAGIYNYTLYVNDKKIDTRQMVITR